MGGTVIIASGLVLFASDLEHFETGADQDQDHIQHELFMINYQSRIMIMLHASDVISGQISEITNIRYFATRILRQSVPFSKLCQSR